MAAKRVATNPRMNRLLAALAEPDYDRIAARLEFAPLALGEVLYESGNRMDHAYFPTTSIVSLLYVMANGASAEIAIVGNDGIVGISMFMGGQSTPSRAVVQSGGEGYRLNSRFLMEEFNEYGPTAHLLLRYTQALITQVAQTAVCNRHHTVDQQLCRWLLLSLDRLPSNELVMTQELISNMLGVRREGVTEAAGKLQSAGLIDYSRGRIRVLDRRGLERACMRVLWRRAEGDRPPAAGVPLPLNVHVRTPGPPQSGDRVVAVAHARPHAFNGRSSPHSNARVRRMDSRSIRRTRASNRGRRPSVEGMGAGVRHRNDPIPD